MNAVNLPRHMQEQIDSKWAGVYPHAAIMWNEAVKTTNIAVPEEYPKSWQEALSSDFQFKFKHKFSKVLPPIIQNKYTILDIFKIHDNFYQAVFQFN